MKGDCGGREGGTRPEGEGAGGREPGPHAPTILSEHGGHRQAGRGRGCAGKEEQVVSVPAECQCGAG